MKYGKEIWKAVVGYEGFYEVSSYGQVRSVDRTVLSGGFYRRRNGKLLSPAIRNKNNAKYYFVSLHKEGKLKMKLIQCLVAKAFVPNPENKPQVNHIDGNKLNNHKTNLEWNTAKENKHHSMYVLNSYSHGENHPDAKINDDIVRAIRKQFIDNPTLNKAQLAREIGICKQSIGRIISGEGWRHVV